MKILFVITRSDVMGGASVHLLDLALGLKNFGHQVHILVGGTGVFQERADALNLTVSTVPSLIREIRPFKDIRAYFQLKQAIKDFSPDLVHLHSSKAGILGRLACRRLNIPCVFTAHGWAFTEGVHNVLRLFYRVTERLMARFADKIITVSDYDRNLALRCHIADESKIERIHNGVSDISEFTGLVKHSQTDSVRFIMVARFESPKDHARALRVFSRVKHLGWKLEFVGDGPQMSTAIELAKQLEISEKVIFSGASSQVKDKLAASDVFILLSRWEGLPLTILEAMSLGLPIIASNVGGVSETIDRDCGFLVESTSDDGLLSAIESLICSVQLRARLGMAARGRYEMYFTLPRMINDTFAIYNQVVDK